MKLFGIFKKSKDIVENNVIDTFENEKMEWLNKVPDCNSENETQNRELRALFGFQADIFKCYTGKKLWDEYKWKR